MATSLLTCLFLVVGGVGGVREHGGGRELQLQEGDVEKFHLILANKVHIQADRRIPTLAIDSICKHHPRANITVYDTTGYNDVSFEPKFQNALRSKGCNVQKKNIDIREYIAELPIHTWVQENWADFSSGYGFESDLLRLALLYKEGGWYLDTDILLLKPMPKVENAAGFWHKCGVNNAVLHSTKGNSLLLKVMAKIPKFFNKHQWVSIGPYMLTSVFGGHRCPENYTHQAVASSSPSECIDILPRTAFYYVGVGNTRPLFNTTDGETYNSAKKRMGDMFLLHFWNSQSKMLKIQKDSIMDRLHRENCVVCQCCSPSDDAMLPQPRPHAMFEEQLKVEASRESVRDFFMASKGESSSEHVSPPELKMPIFEDQKFFKNCPFPKDSK
ncbi:hypothetical protein AAMO2058_001590600 [Amorphochlora amoebiformis]